MENIQNIFDNFNKDDFMAFLSKLLDTIFETLSKIYGWA